MKFKIILIAAAVAAFFSSSVQAYAPFQQVVPMRVLCVKGSPEPLLMKLNEQYGEVPKYQMEVFVDSPMPIAMIITENANNNDGRGSSTMILVNPNLAMSCIFFTGKSLKDSGANVDVPAKEPASQGGKLDV